MKRKGFLLISTLLILIVLFLVGMGLLSSQAARYRAALRQSEAIMARQIALAGLEEARAKLDQDICFPPPPSGSISPLNYYTAGPYIAGNQTQPLFTYSESLTIPGTPPVQGTYAVTIDSTNCIANFWEPAAYPPPPGTSMVITITSVGVIGDMAAPTSQYIVKGELDCSLLDRATFSSNNPRYFYYTHIEDQELP